MQIQRLSWDTGEASPPDFVGRTYAPVQDQLPGIDILPLPRGMCPAPLDMYRCAGIQHQHNIATWGDPPAFHLSGLVECLGDQPFPPGLRAGEIERRPI